MSSEAKGQKSVSPTISDRPGGANITSSIPVTDHSAESNVTQLIHAAKADQWQHIINLANPGVDLNALDVGKYNAVCAAAMAKNKRSALTLIALGASGPRFIDPLHAALLAGHIKLALSIIERSKARWIAGGTPPGWKTKLHESDSADKNDFSAATLACEDKTDPKYHAKNTNHYLFNLLFKDITHYDSKNPALDYKHVFAISPLHRAISREREKNYKELALAMIFAGAPLDQTDGIGNTPADITSDLDIFLALIESGATVGMKNESKQFLAKLLTRKVPGGFIDSKITERDYNLELSKMPLFRVIREDRADMTLALIQAGINVNMIAKQAHKNTALHYAAAMGNFTIVLMLLQAGAKTTVKNNQEKTPVTIAKETEHSTIANYLTVWEEQPFPSDEKLEQSTQLAVDTSKKEIKALKQKITRKRDKYRITGWTPLHYAAQAGDTKKAITIIEKNISAIEAKDFLGRTPLHIAITRGHLEMTVALIACHANILTRITLTNGKISPLDNAFRIHKYAAAALPIIYLLFQKHGENIKLDIDSLSMPTDAGGHHSISDLKASLDSQTIALLRLFKGDPPHALEKLHLSKLQTVFRDAGLPHDLGRYLVWELIRHRLLVPGTKQGTQGKPIILENTFEELCKANPLLKKYSHIKNLVWATKEKVKPMLETVVKQLEQKCENGIAR